MISTKLIFPPAITQLAAKPISRVFLWLSFVLGVALLVLNIYGEIRGPRSELLYSAPDEHYRFPNDAPISFDEAMFKLDQLQTLSDSEFVQQATVLVSQSLGHIQWERHDPELYFQRVPVWENFILHLMGRFSGLPFYERYHYADYKKSLARGIGVCGDASMILNQLLDARGIENDIISFEGHVVLSVNVNGEEIIADPDFGVLVPKSLEDLPKSLSLIRSVYVDKGYSDREAEVMKWIYSTDYSVFDDVYHFITKRVWFEYLAYFFKWAIPVFLMALAVLLLISRKPFKENN